MRLKVVLFQSKQWIDLEKYEHPTETLYTTFLNPVGEKALISGLYMYHRIFLTHPSKSFRIKKCWCYQWKNKSTINDFSIKTKYPKEMCRINNTDADWIIPWLIDDRKIFQKQVLPFNWLTIEINNMIWNKRKNIKRLVALINEWLKMCILFKKNHWILITYKIPPPPQTLLIYWNKMDTRQAEEN